MYTNIHYVSMLGLRLATKSEQEKFYENLDEGYDLRHYKNSKIIY